MILGHFAHVRPPYLVAQSDTLDWLAQAHARTEARQNPDLSLADQEALARKMHALLRRYGCPETRIKTRGVVIPDFTHQNWEAMELFGGTKDPLGPFVEERNCVLQKAGREACTALFPASAEPPAHLIHVSCTWYVSPSCAQERVVQNGWERETVVTHAYHMGCYAAMPALLMARGFLAGATPMERGGRDGRVDLLHTEFCSGHLQTHDHSPEQLVVQSLFADGSIRYSAFRDGSGLAAAAENGPATGLQLSTLHEIMIPDTLTAITWECSARGMKMGLSREVPALIAAHLDGFLEALCARGNRSKADLLRTAQFAIHPGGPKIIDEIQRLCGLAPEQTELSRIILRDYGNMSSATLPHVWELICGETGIPVGTPVVSLAFGPGLCISGGLFEKVGAR
jgi:predicted naringenin-chalcone synthase